MSHLLHPLFALLASVTRQDLARQVAYLKEENKILRSRLPERLVATDSEKRRLLRYGQKIGSTAEGADLDRKLSNVPQMGMREGGSTYREEVDCDTKAWSPANTG